MTPQAAQLMPYVPSDEQLHAMRQQARAAARDAVQREIDQIMGDVLEFQTQGDDALPTPSAPRPGLGDMVAAGLEAVGVTKERVSRLVGGDCGCQQRQQQLNEIGRKLGIG